MSKSKFKIVNEGYDVTEVNKFLEIITREFEKMLHDNEEHERKIVELETEITRLSDRKTNIDLLNEELEISYNNLRMYNEKLLKDIKRNEKKLHAYDRTIQEAFGVHLNILQCLNDEYVEEDKID